MKEYQNIQCHPLYNTWLMIKQRCNNPNHTYYHLYGGAGVKMCERWKNSFYAFVNDVGERPSPKHTIDRYPNKNGNYDPDNFRWATWSEQNSNRARYATITVSCKRNGIYVAYMRKNKIGECLDRQTLIDSLKEKFPKQKMAFVPG